MIPRNRTFPENITPNYVRLLQVRDVGRGLGGGLAAPEGKKGSCTDVIFFEMFAAGCNVGLLLFYLNYTPDAQCHSVNDIAPNCWLITEISAFILS